MLHNANRYRHILDPSFVPICLETAETALLQLSTNNDIVAVLIDSSVLKGLNKAEQTKLIGDLAVYSTFAWLRIDVSASHLSNHEIEAIVRSAQSRKDHVPSTILSLQNSPQIKESELESIFNAQHILNRHKRVNFTLGDLTQGQSHLLVAAAYEMESRLRNYEEFTVKSVEARFLRGGRTDAKLALVKTNDDGKYYVAKIDRKESLLRETQRFRTFIQRWDETITPELFIHGDSAVLYFKLVNRADRTSQPAPMLWDVLELCWNKEIFPAMGTDELSPAYTANLESGLRNLCAHLAELNKGTSTNHDFTIYENPSVSQINDLEEKGYNWRLGPDFGAARTKATAILAAYRERGIIHGDVHLRNILVSAEESMHLIDFASSGRGHPAVDLVRLQCALMFSQLRQYCEEADIDQFVFDLSITRHDMSALIEKYPAVFGPSPHARICLGGMVAARNNAVGVMESHGGGAIDYLAALFLVATQSLIMPELQQTFVRSVIRVLIPTIMSSG
ncbi:MAG: aminoglycoside phosphotransferase family protein [Bacteroidetes bacterium]|nr:aminoglycoside phosphotransferase family protein [Bacteroidota bacterium]